MTEAASAPEVRTSRGDSSSSESGRFTRVDAMASRRRILAAAAALASESDVSMSQIAAAAGVGRSTLYRHFPSRALLRAALRGAPPLGAAAKAGWATTALPVQAVGELSREESAALEVARVLEEVPPYLVADQLVAEARRLARVAVALYVADLDGSCLLRLAGADEFPERIEAPPALGPEIVAEGVPAFLEQLREQLPGCQLEPLWLRGRVVAALLCLGAPHASLSELAQSGAAALELAEAYTDFIACARRRMSTTPAAEIQQHLFPPRIMRVGGAHVAGAVRPSYAVGGNWFDFAENRDGAWLAIADAAGTGAVSAGLAAAALGALRSARRAGDDLAGAVALMDETVRGLGNDALVVTAIVSRWTAATATLSWVNCGHRCPWLADTSGALTEIEGGKHAALGADPPGGDWLAAGRRLYPGERVVFVTEGVIDRRTSGGGRFGVDGLRGAVAHARYPTAAGTAMAIQTAVCASGQEPLEDDASVVVLAVD